MSKLNVEPREVHVPLDRCRSYPGIPTRFDLNVSEIGESIHREGQQVPGAAIQYGNQYFVFDGRRRLLGCRYSRYRFGGPSRYWAKVYEDLDEIQIFTEAFVRNTVTANLLLLEEIKYFLEVNMRFGKKVAAQIGVRAGRQADYVREVLDVCDWIEPKLARLHRIEVMTKHLFELTHLDHLSAYKNDDLLFYQMAAVAASRKMDPYELNPSGIELSVSRYAPWFEKEFPEFAAVATTQTPIAENHLVNASKEVSNLGMDEPKTSENR